MNDLGLDFIMVCVFIGGVCFIICGIKGILS